MRLTHQGNGNGLVRVAAPTDNLVRVTAPTPDKIYFRDIVLACLVLGGLAWVFLGTVWVLEALK